MLREVVREQLDRELFGLLQSARDSRMDFASLRTETKRILDEFTQSARDSGGLGSKLLYFGWEDWWKQAGHVLTGWIYEYKNSRYTETSISLHTAISAMVHLWCDGTMHRRVKLRTELQDALFDYLGLRDKLSPSDYAPAEAVTTISATGAPRQLSEAITPNPIVPTDNSTEWLRISEAGKISGVNKGLICRAADRKELKDNGETGSKRRINSADFNRWLLVRAGKPELQESEAAIRKKLGG